MALNKFMHPRNRYKKEKPSFLKLALKYPDFRAQVTQDEDGKVLLDFKNADALRALTTCLLKEDFGLTVELPPDRLVPTLPLRLNYIHWLEDIVGRERDKWGIDIGTGASCIYPLLAVKMNGWKFLATEADPENCMHARKNVEKNGMAKEITVFQVEKEVALLTPLNDPSLPGALPKKYDFCMCNPPFFADHMEAQAVGTSRSMDRPEAMSVSTASPEECIAHGGEVGFVRQMIQESLLLKERVTVYSSMLGKKTSLAALKEELRANGVSKYSSTELCQGRTMRWALAWSFDSSIQFPKSEFESRKEKPPLRLVVAPGAGGVAHEVHALAQFIKDLMAQLKVHVFQGKTAKAYSSLTLTASHNTWTHQRRQRRQKQRQAQEQGHQTDGQFTMATSVNSSKSDNKGISNSSNNKSSKSSSSSNNNNSSNNASSNNKGVPASDKGVASSSSDLKPKPSLMVPRQIKSIDNKKVQVKNTTSVQNNKVQASSENVSQAPEKLSVETKNLVVGIKRTYENEESTVSENKKAKIEGEVGSNDDKSTGNNETTSDYTNLSLTNSPTVTLVTDQPTNISPNNLTNTPAEKTVRDTLMDNTLTNTSMDSLTDALADKLVTDTSPKDFILKCVVRLKRVEKVNVHLEMEFLGGGRELMYQLFTVLKNKLVPPAPAAAAATTSSEATSA